MKKKTGNPTNILLLFTPYLIDKNTTMLKSAIVTKWPVLSFSNTFNTLELGHH